MQTNQSKTARQLRELLGVLIVQFILGLSLTTWIDFEPNSTSITQKTFLVLHIVLAVYLLVIASLRCWKAFKAHSSVSDSVVGFVFIVIAFGAGSYAVQNGNAWATFVMALGFLVAFVAYGKSLLAVASK